MKAYLLVVKKLRAVVSVEDYDSGFQEIQTHAVETGNVGQTKVLQIFKLEKHVWFNEWKEASDLLASKDFLEVDVFNFFGVRYTFVSALVCLKSAQSATSWLEKRKWRKMGVRSMKKLKTWAKKGDGNVIQFIQILQFQLAVLNSNHATAEASIKDGIATAKRNGFLQDRALAHELAAGYFAAKGDDYWANYHCSSAQTCYSDWGATAKLKKEA